MALAGDAAAVDLDRLIMPGPVIAAHAEWEGQCGKCHQPLDRVGQDVLCLDCHEEQREDQENGTGFHGRSAAVRAADACRSCHPEHRGREADVLGLIEEVFDHRETDYPLDGAHARLACRACHAEDERHREAPHDCVACHREDDPHGDAMSDDCVDCHTTADWREARFDHDETRFPLRGSHRSVSCALCHTGPAAEKPPRDCVGCHRLDDVHRGTLGKDCAACHGVDRWASSSFDHERKTGFALRGGHGGIPCGACHRTPPETGDTPRECAACHGSQDVHAGRNGTECGVCHGIESWGEVLFDHARDARFELDGAHGALRCEQCHGSRLDGLSDSTTCIDCHRADDVHAGSLAARCEQCHGTRSWSRPIVFEHDVVRFPLLGLHATTACEQCHVSRAFDRAEPACRSCHARDDVHDGTLGDDCGRCHGPNGWPLWEFDHGRETSFVLHGAHEDLACSACHRTDGPRASSTSSRCVFCHAADDAHFGAFGESCETCHTDERWEFIRRR
jgi:hypothetical protein